MNRSEALQVMAVLTAGMPMAFEEDTAVLWLEFIEALDNPGRAGAAARDYVKSWKGFRPAWAEYEECYQRRAAPEKNELGPGGGGRTMTLPEYLEQLERTAITHAGKPAGQAADRELDEWAYHMRPPGAPSRTKWGAGGGAARVFLQHLAADVSS